MKDDFRTIFRSYSDIFFLSGAWLGLALFAVTLVSPFVALAGILSVLAAYSFARFLGVGKDFLSLGFYTYNPLLVGLSIGYLFEVTPLTIFFLVAAGVFTFLLTMALAHVFRTQFSLPVLSLPFVVVSSLAYLASLRYTNLLVTAPHTNALLTTDLGLPLWIAGYFQSLGAILFSPSVVVGLGFALVLVFASRLLFLLSVMGYYVGALTRMLMLGSAPQAFGDLNSFNFILIAMALGGVFLVPSIFSYLLAAVAVTVTTVFLDSMTVFWSYHGIPAFTLPFNLTALTVVYVLGLVQHPLLVRLGGRTPEDTLDAYLANRLRYRGSQRTMLLPFSGAWTVWQGFDGRWTHKGAWRYGYDFVIEGARGKTHRGDGESLEDYFAFGKPVLAPVRGRVFRTVTDLPDNPPGTADRTNNWGNLVIVEDPRGFYVELSHLKHDSIRVNEGDWVERGAVLGACGNSGYSPQPHIHVQIQATGEVGAGTLPFSFVSYTSGGLHQGNALPEEGDCVEPLYVDKRLDRQTNFLLDEVQEYSVWRNGAAAGNVRLTVKMAADGTFYFESPRGRLYFGKHEGTFYFYRVEGDDRRLEAMLLALPRLPLAYRDKLRWEDYAPVGLASRGWRRAAILVVASLRHNLAETRVEQTFASRRLIRSTVRSKLSGLALAAEVELEEQLGFRRFKLDELELRREQDVRLESTVRHTDRSPDDAGRTG